MTLLKILRERAYEKKEVTLASGRVSDFYIDCKKAFLWQDGLVGAAETLIHVLRMKISSGEWEPPNFVAGTGLGGGPLATAMVMEAHNTHNRLNMLYVRKETKDHGSLKRIEGGYGTPPWVIAGMNPSDNQVILVEDVVTSGGSALDACELLTEAGYRVQGVLALVDRLEGAQEHLLRHGYKLFSVFTKADFMETDDV